MFSTPAWNTIRTYIVCIYFPPSIEYGQLYLISNRHYTPRQPLTCVWVSPRVKCLSRKRRMYTNLQSTMEFELFELSSPPVTPKRRYAENRRKRNIERNYEAAKEFLQNFPESSPDIPRNGYEIKLLNEESPSRSSRWEPCTVLHMSNGIYTVSCEGKILNVASHFIRGIFDTGRKVCVEFSGKTHDATVLGLVDENTPGMEETKERLKRDNCSTSPGVLVEYDDTSIEIIPWDTVDKRMLKRRRIIV